MTLSFMVQHLEFLHVVYMGVALIVLNKQGVVGTSGLVKKIVSFLLIYLQPVGPLSQFLFFLCILFYFLVQDLNVKGTASVALELDEKISMSFLDDTSSFFVCSILGFCVP
jgi:hypothetical protein